MCLSGADAYPHCPSVLTGLDGEATFFRISSNSDRAQVFEKTACHPLADTQQSSISRPSIRLQSFEWSRSWNVSAGILTRRSVSFRNRESATFNGLTSSIWQLVIVNVLMLGREGSRLKIPPECFEFGCSACRPRRMDEKVSKCLRRQTGFWVLPIILRTALHLVRK